MSVKGKKGVNRNDEDCFMRKEFRLLLRDFETRLRLLWPGRSLGVNNAG